jgi:hypothetical protein
MTAPLIRMKMHQPEEVMLSYLCGLAPVGETFEIDRKTLMEDLGLAHSVYYYRLIGRLIRLGAVKRISCGASRRTGVLIVLKRPEQVIFPSRIPNGWRSRNKWAAFRAGLNPALAARQLEFRA